MKWMLLISTLFVTAKGMQTETEHQIQKKLVVAVIDTGVDRNHVELKDQIWTNSGEVGIDKNGNSKSTNGIDDDENGYIDDVNGWNFVANTNNVDDMHGHGTHVAGIINTMGNTKIPDQTNGIQIMILKFTDPKNSPQTDVLSATVKSIEYAVKMKADIINYSAGGYVPSSLEKNAIQKAERAGILMVTAAGNDGGDLDAKPFYPASYGLSNVLSVSAVTTQFSLVRSSNFSTHQVNVAAPGDKIISYLPGSEYGSMTGTSQAAAWTTGVAVRWMFEKISVGQRRPMPLAIKNQIESTSTVSETLKNRVRTSAVVSAERILKMKTESDGFNNLKLAQINQEQSVLWSSYKLQNDRKQTP